MERAVEVEMTEPSLSRTIILPPLKEWDAVRYDQGDTSEADGYESSDYVDGWNEALCAVMTLQDADVSTNAVSGSGTARKKQSSISPEFIRGAQAAADLAGQYNGSSTHDYRLDDCILHKLNLRRAKPRKNKKQLSSPDHVWTCGFATALAEVYRLLVGGNQPKEICRIAAAAGVDLAALRKAKVSAFDVRALKRAGLP